MKFYDIVFLMLIFNVMGNALVSSGVFDSMGLSAAVITNSPSDTSSSLNSIESSLNTSTQIGIANTDSFNILVNIENFIRSVTTNKFFYTLKNYLFFPSVIMGWFNVPSAITTAWTIITGLVYIIGLLQFITGRFFPLME